MVIKIKVCLSQSPSSGKEQQCGGQSKMSGTSRQRYVCVERKGVSQITGRALGTT